MFICGGVKPNGAFLAMEPQAPKGIGCRDDHE